jgi:glycosyltransferase involved in cell wall biosynthesis
MKLCFLCNEYPPFRNGGIGTATQATGRALAARGHAVKVIGLYNAQLASPTCEEDCGVQVHRILCPPSRFGWVEGRYKLFTMLSHWAANKEVDLIEIPDWEGPAAGWGALPVPVVVRLHGSLSYFARETGVPIQGRTLFLERNSFHRATYCSSTSRYTAKVTEGLFGRHRHSAKVIYNFVEVDLHQPLTVRSRNKVVFSGTLTAKKGVVPLLRAWPEVLRLHPSAELHLFGKDGYDDGQPLRPKLLAMLSASESASVHFHGHVDRSRLRNEFRTGRLAVFPSYSEAFGLAPLEAMGEHCPVIYTKRSSGPELITEGSSGLLIEPDNTAELTDAISRVLRDDDLAARLGAGGRTTVLEKFSPQAQLPRYEAYYEECLQRFVAAAPRRGMLSRLGLLKHA